MALRGAVVVAGALIAGAVGWVVFVITPDNLADLLGVVLVIVTAAVAARIASQFAGSVLAGYNVAEVAVEGPITRDGGRPFPSSPRSPGADDVVEQIERADDDGNAQALLVKLNTPGGQPVPADDIRAAAESFDGPTVAYATDVCASGGYWIASGCDELWARDGSIVGSIGVRSPRMTATGLLEKLGVRYEPFTAGEYKEAGSPFTEMDRAEREYLQGIVDGYYEDFVERVAEGRDMAPDAIRDTEARVYLGDDARKIGLVDGLGTREDAEDRLAERIGEDTRVRQFEPELGLGIRLRDGAARVAYALGAGAAGVLTPEEEPRQRLRL